VNQAKLLDKKIRGIVAREREALGELITELKNLDSIRGCEDIGFKNLFEYLTRGLKYSNGAAQRRIDAARLAKDVPDLAEKLESGALDFHHVTTLSKAVRQVRKTRKVSAQEKCELIAKVQSESEGNTKQMVAEFFDLEVIYENKKSVQKDASVRMELTLSPELAQKIEQAQALISHAVPTKDLVCFLEYVSERIIKQKTQVPREYKKRIDSTATMAVNIPERVHRMVRNEQPACTNCGSTWFPQTDHRKSKWFGGTNEPNNLQTLCGPCNRAKYGREYQEISSIGLDLP
jgi:5-methylcytosine-specific restriction endonuclease McrA